MIDVSLVAAVGPGGTIGPSDSLPQLVDRTEATEFEEWFLGLTYGGIIIMGARSLLWLHETGFVGLPAEWQIEVWEGRSRDAHDFIEGLKEYGKPIYICGGLNTYETFMPYVTQFLIRRVAMHSPHENILPPLFGRPQ